MLTGSDPYSAQSKENKWYFSIGLALLGVALMFGLLGAGLLGSAKKGSMAVTQSFGKQAPPMTQAGAGDGAMAAAGASDGSVTQAPVETKTMPKDVLDWLKHLERIERLRKSMSGEQIADLMVQFTMLQGVGATEEVVKGLLQDDPDVENMTPANEIGKRADENKAKWEDLIKDFDSLPPPPSCVTIRNAYSQCLGETKAMIGEVLGAIGSASEDPRAAVDSLMALKGKSTSRIDTAGKQTDELVQQVCSKYEVRKWFSISGDVGGGIGGILGGLGGR